MIEFVSGPADSDWGSLRAKMGHSEPWEPALLFPWLHTLSFAVALA